MSILSKPPIPVYVIVMANVNSSNPFSLKWVIGQIERVERENAGKRIRIYSSDHCVALNLAQNGIQAPWGLPLVSDDTDSELFAMANKVFYKFVDITSRYEATSYKEVALMAMLHDDYIRRFRDQLLVEALCKMDQERGEYGVHILFTAFPFYTKFSDRLVDIVEVIHPAVDTSNIRFSIRHIAVTAISVLRTVYSWAVFWPRSLSIKRKLTVFNTDSKKILEATDVVQKPKILFVVTEPIGGKNCLDPLISMVKTIKKSFDCDYRILVDNKHSVDYLNRHGVESQLISKSENLDHKNTAYMAGKLIKKIALEQYEKHKKSIDGLLYMTLAFSNTLKNLEDLLYRIEFCDSFIGNYKPDAVMVYPDEAYSGFAAACICRKRKIPTMMFFQSIISNHQRYSVQHTDKVAVYGTHGRDILLNLEFPSDKLILTGNPKLDLIPLRSKAADMRYAQDLLPEWDGRPLLVLATHLLVPMGELAVANFFSSLRGEGMELFYPVVKLHPDDDLNSYERLLSKNLPESKIPLIKSCELYALLNCADIVVTGASTVGAEAALFDKPIMTLNFSGEPFPVDYAKESIAIEVDKKEEILPAIKKMLSDADTIRNLAEGRKKFIERYAYRMDGKSGYRIISALLESAKHENENDMQRIINGCVYK